VHRVMPDGEITARPMLTIEDVDGSYRMSIDKENALLNCDCMVLLIK